MLEYFGSTKVESIDNSTYEGATHILDMNKPLPLDLYGEFDTVIDGGSLEHIFNVPQALRNLSNLCRIGGQIIHILPSNNFCGHGFWQFSPELFISLYSTEHGYGETEVFLADLSNSDKWFQVKKPIHGKRVNVRTSSEVYVLLRTVLLRRDFIHENIQQSDYVYEWNKAVFTAQPISSADRLNFKKVIKRFPILYGVLSKIYYLYLRANMERGLNNRNPGLTELVVRSRISPLG